MPSPAPHEDPATDAAAAVIIATALTPRVCDAYALLLEAVGIHYSLLRGELGYVFRVDAADAARAREALTRYVEENVPRPVEPPRRLAGNGLSAVAAYLLAELAVAIAASRSLFGADWFDSGTLQGTALRAGQWWRAVTALTLHADLAHLGSNLGFGALCLGLLARVYGGGVAVALTLVAAVAGNLLEGAFMASGRESLGASGAVFAALGILGTVHWPTRTNRARWYLRGATFVAALVLLALLGTGDARTDIAAHALGFGLGALLGLPVRRAAVASRRIQRLTGLAAAALLAAAWTAALLHGP